jgi:hypothetical protein
MRRACYGKLGPNQKKLAFLFRDSLRGLSVGEQNTKIKSMKEFRTKQTRPGPATRAASYVVSCALSPLSGGMTASARQRSKGVPPHLPKPVADPSPCDHESTTAAVGQRPCPAPRSRMGEEAATPGQPVALARVYWIPPGNSPSRITGCRWLCRNHSASSGTFTFRCKHSQPDRCAPQPKKAL